MYNIYQTNTKNNNMKKIYKNLAFTLAEIMIVLTIVGVLTAILLPVALHGAPDENIMKFKKANGVLGKVIEELVNSDKYYYYGDLSKKADGTILLGSFSNSGGAVTTDTNIIKYFCASIADLLSVQKTACSTAKTAENDSTYTFVQIPSNTSSMASWQCTMAQGKLRFDKACLDKASTVGAEITTPDGIVYYQANPAATFGVMWSTSGQLFLTKDSNGLLDTYKIFCIDVDGIGKGEAPFGYGIRIDGKIIPGARADEWIKKSVQKD